MSNDYKRLKDLLAIDKAGRWLVRDSEDDFFPDVLNFADVADKLSDYLDQRQHRLLQIDAYPWISDFVPKSSGMVREAVWLHPVHRLLYLATLHYLLPKLDHHLPTEVYSYRLDSDNPNSYPFPNRVDRWKSFHNDFRLACLDNTTGAVLVTDIASFYDHIRVDELASRIKAMLGQGMSDDDQLVVDFLQRLIRQWSTDGYGIPQNLDPSSFYGSLFLSGVDHEMIDKRYRYFRYVDDIRICAKNKKQALRAMHDLQAALGRHRMFLASDKTRIIVKGTPQFEDIVDVTDDAYISEIEDIIARASQNEMNITIPKVFNKLEFHSSQNGDDRKFRAYANRLLQFADFVEFKERILNQLVPFVVSRMNTHAGRSDTWTRLLHAAPNGQWIDMAMDLLIKDASVYNWQRFYIWKILTAREEIPRELHELALSTITSSVSELESYQAIICYGKHADNQQRERLFAQYFSAQRSYPVQRAILIATQELHADMRGRLYKRALSVSSEHKQLVEYLESIETTKYGILTRAERKLPEQPRTIEAGIQRGIGKANGQVIHYRLSRKDYDYE